MINAVISEPLLEIYESELDYLAILDEKALIKAEINLTRLTNLPKRGLILSSASNEFDFYSRCFYPKHNIIEDSVTGSAYSVLASYWSKRLGKLNLHALQGLQRQGQVFCTVLAKRIHIAGYCRWYLKGQLVI